MLSELLEKPFWILFLISWLFYLTGLVLFSQMVWDSNTYNIGYTGADFDTYLSNIRKIDYLRYALSPLWILGITAIIWVVIKSGLLIAQIEIKPVFLLKIILIGLVILSLPFWIKSVLLILVHGSYTPDDVKFFFPGSIVSFIDISEMKEVTINTLSHINIYHIGFTLFIAWQISENSEFRFFKSLLLVISTYGFGIVLLRCLILVFAM